MKSKARHPYLIGFLLMQLTALNAFAQQPHLYPPDSPEITENKGTLVVHQTPETKKVLELYTLQKQNDRGIKGYTINIFRDSGQDAKERALQARSRFINVFDDVPVEVKYNAPFWIVYVGKFYTKSDARKFMKEMEYLFRNTAYIAPEYYDIPDNIE